MMPASHAAPTSPPYRGARRPRARRDLDDANDVHRLLSGAGDEVVEPGREIAGPVVRTLVNLSRPNRIGAIVNTVRRTGTPGSPPARRPELAAVCAWTALPCDLLGELSSCLKPMNVGERTTGPHLYVKTSIGDRVAGMSDPWESRRRIDWPPAGGPGAAVGLSGSWPRERRPRCSEEAARRVAGSAPSLAALPPGQAGGARASLRSAHERPRGAPRDRGRTRPAKVYKEHLNAHFAVAVPRATTAWPQSCWPRRRPRDEGSGRDPACARARAARAGWATEIGREARDRRERRTAETPEVLQRAGTYQKKDGTHPHAQLSLPRCGPPPPGGRSAG